MQTFNIDFVLWYNTGTYTKVIQSKFNSFFLICMCFTILFLNWCDRLVCLNVSLAVLWHYGWKCGFQSVFLQVRSCSASLLYLNSLRCSSVLKFHTTLFFIFLHASLFRIVFFGHTVISNIWIWIWIYLHSINPKQVNTFGYRTSQKNTCWYK
jgi:hypothetical protein